ncbi:ABC-type multidrug transport system, ATPase and permease component [Sanguibacter keddieii DSM 10542]|uniref:ABC-type multidrug transport system, ATPase and permease component n=1 Tax=Sanguibacter keddieii (strain ATCC 51767 / DSM 10542 / NCFB 3025 / ST-74) TaxID=446469 RepID=D1BGA3_SANKS|nr:ABC transporter ATP-binding protein [Sanguibacter keddieii]ACZ23620.1 ABC-type multidrug transport system, ATPase and permease component [Sanguibacter keddieii DSM 10542]
MSTGTAPGPTSAAPHPAVPQSAATHSPLPVATTRQTRRAMWQLLRVRRARLAATSAVLLLAAVCGLATPALLGVLVDHVVEGEPTSSLVTVAVGLLLAGLAAAGLGMVGRVMLATLCEGALADLREDVLGAAVALPVARVDAAGTGDVVSRVSGDVEAVSEAITGVLPAFTSAALTIALTLVGLGALDWRFAVAAVVAAPLQAFALRWFLARSGPVYREVRVAEAERTEQVIETVSARRTVVSLGLGARHEQLVADRSRRAIGLSVHATRLLTRFYNQLNAAELVGLASVLTVGYWLVGEGTATVGAATAAALFFYRLFDPIGTVLGQVDELQKAGAGLARLFGLTLLTSSSEEEPASGRASARATSEPSSPEPSSSEPSSSEPSSPPAPGSPLVVIDDVSFDYGERRVLDSVSLTVRAGEHVALVGASGAGKTTLASIVLGIHPPAAGSLTVAGQWPPPPRTTVLVSQQVHVFSGTLAEDLRLAAPEATDDELLAALARVGASWAPALGLETAVGAGGHELSADQAQQLALARLVLTDPPLAVLDEATAEAGSGSAASLDTAARAALEGRTAIVIAHRLSQAADADRVVVLDAGRVVESGSHQDLVEAGGTYARLWEAWVAGHRR